MSDCENTIRAGRITGNPASGLCDRICIEVKQVFDGCISRNPSMSYQLVIEDPGPDYVMPFTFVRAISSGDAVTENLIVTPISDKSISVSCDIVMPVSVVFTDATGKSGTAASSITLHKNAVLRVPSRALMPYSIEVMGSMASEIGNFVNRTTVNIICCVVIVLKTTIMSDILVPSYGYSVYPDCQEGEGDLCNALLSLPLFPPLDE